ncbi:hypothetical protein [Domibacillus aminovorans]|uniref:Uncharacterized protein n=1 Tax=Domibacillus aminovorans TaxID=29332 RepID=A0A177L875_9BACI|nr:hypothetical protein [Domibacillus aminovorans]OAH61502.1 hypothetical protein AWH49_12510 [Domibacillus aminovorans]
MAVSKLISTEEFKKMMSYEVYAENHKQQQSIKLLLLKSVEEAYGEGYHRLKEGTRNAIDMMCWFSSEQGFFFAKDNYFADRYDVSDKTIRNVAKKLREAGILFTVYRRSSTQNGRSAPIHLFTDHPYFSYWAELLNLDDFQAHYQAENAEIPCVSKEEDAKNDPNSYLSLNKSFNNIRKEEAYLDASFTPSHIPQKFVTTVKMFYGEAKDIYRFWGKTMLAYRTSRLDVPLEEIVPIALQSFKESIFAQKQKRIKGSFEGYFFGALRNMFQIEKRKEILENHPIFYNFLET